MSTMPTPEELGRREIGRLAYVVSKLGLPVGRKVFGRLTDLDFRFMLNISLRRLRMIDDDDPKWAKIKWTKACEELNARYPSRATLEAVRVLLEWIHDDLKFPASLYSKGVYRRIVSTIRRPE